MSAVEVDRADRGGIRNPTSDRFCSRAGARNTAFPDPGEVGPATITCRQFTCAGTDFTTRPVALQDYQTSPDSTVALREGCRTREILDEEGPIGAPSPPHHRPGLAVDVDRTD